MHVPKLLAISAFAASASASPVPEHYVGGWITEVLPPINETSHEDVSGPMLKTPQDDDVLAPVLKTPQDNAPPRPFEKIPPIFETGPAVLDPIVVSQNDTCPYEKGACFKGFCMDSECDSCHSQHGDCVICNSRDEGIRGMFGAIFKPKDEEKWAACVACTSYCRDTCC